MRSSVQLHATIPGRPKGIDHDALKAFVLEHSQRRFGRAARTCHSAAKRRSILRALGQHVCRAETRLIHEQFRDIARQIGSPGASRAVGMANGANPIAIIVPCHRVIGSNGTLTGYGGGLDRKAWLLDHERGQCALSLTEISEVAD